MKILHTADWHLGQKLYDYDRADEQTSFLNQIAEIVRQQKPDAMIVSGDIFHTCNPTVETQTMFVEALLKIRENHPPLTIVLTAGNHDSYSRLEIDKQLWQKLNVHVIGNIARNEDRTADYEKHIIEIKPNDEVLGYVIAVPYCFMHNFPPVQEDRTQDKQSYFFQQILNKVNEHNDRQLPVVLMAHLAISDSDITGHDDVTGGMDYTNIQDLGLGYDYLALGHIHRPQNIKNSNGRARYSGTPIPVSFNENYDHSVTMVEIDRHLAKPRCREIEIANPKPLITLPTEGALPFEETLSLLRNFDAETPAYIRLNVSTEIGESLSPDCTYKAIELTSNKKCRFCTINKFVNESESVPEQRPEYDITKLKRLSIEDILKITQQQGALTDVEKDMLRDVIIEVEQEINQ